MLQSPIAQITTLLMTAVAVWALASGRWPERIAGAGVALDWAGSILFQDHRPNHHGQPITFGLDVCMFVMLVALVFKSRRTWVLWGAACALLIILTHVTMMLDTRFTQWSFLTASYVWSLGVVASLGAGTAFEGRRPAAVMSLGGYRLRAAHLSTPNARARSRS